MLISHKHKFITIDIPKTGTRSLRETLTSMEGVIDFVGPPITENPLWQHTTIKRCARGFIERGWDINDYFKYTIIRNPWRRYLSLMLYKKNAAMRYKMAQENDKEWNQEQREQANACLIQWRNLGEDDSRFLKAVINQNFSQYDYIHYRNGELGVDYIGRFENIEDEFNTLCSKVGIPSTQTLRHSNKGTYEKSVGKYYTQELIDMVAEKERWVINQFNYRP